MEITAAVKHEPGRHHVVVRTGDHEQTLAIPARQQSPGSAVNGGELLFLALATCYCNDLYREAAERGIVVNSVQVEVTGRFGGKGEAAQEISYRVQVAADASRENVQALIRATDEVAEIHNTLRQGIPVVLHAATEDVS